MTDGIFKDFWRKVKMLLRGERLRPVHSHPMDCGRCGSPGLYFVRPIDGKRGEWLCQWCFPPFLRRRPASLAGDPR